MTTSSPLILYVITDLELGGVPLHLSRLAKAMRDRGFRIVVVSLAPTGPVGPLLSQAGFDVRSCNGCCGLDFRVISRLGEIIDELQPDLIHSFLFHANQAARIAAILSGFSTHRIICEIQTVEVERKWHLWMDRLMHRLCRFTIGNSPSVIDHLHSAARIPRNRLQLVRGGIEAEKIMTALPADRRSLGLKETNRVLMWVGRLDPVKGLDFLIPAIASIAGEYNIQLLLIGDGPERDSLEKLVHALRLQPHVHFLGPRTDIPSLLQIADLFVFPSRTEGLPNALLEAMAAGKPIVTTDVPGCRDLITHRKTGLLVPYGDTRALTAAVSQLLTEPELSRRLGQAAQRVAAARWNIAATWIAYESIYVRTLTTNS